MQKTAFHEIWTLLSRKVLRGIRVCDCNKVQETPSCVYSPDILLEGDSAADRKLCKKYLHEVGMDGCEHRSFLSLSGGEKQRVLLARVLMQESRMIVLDEPTNHLDVSYQYQIMDILKQQKVTVFSSIHDLNLAALYCEKIIFMYNGRIVDCGTPETVLTRENIRQYFGIDSQINTNPVTGKLQIYYMPSWIKKGMGAAENGL